MDHYVNQMPRMGAWTLINDWYKVLMMAAAISLVHGARIPLSEERWFRPDWPERVSRYFLSHGAAYVEPYYWSGDVFDAFSSETACRYADHLCRLCKKANGPVSIISKSLGFAVAENGLDFLATNKYDVQVHRLIRIVPPDIRRDCHIPLISRVIDITSPIDIMHITLAPPITILTKTLFYNRCRECPRNERIIIPIKYNKHTSFNFDNTLASPYAGLTLFSLYYKCIYDD
jgi:hypothetical protein